MRKVSAVSATSADSYPLMPAQEYSTRPREAATSTMQTAMKMVEIRIIVRALPSRPERPQLGKHGLLQAWFRMRSPKAGATLAPLLIRGDSGFCRLSPAALDALETGRTGSGLFP